MPPIAALLAALDLEGRPVSGGGVMVPVPTQRRGPVGVHILESERTVSLRAFVMRAPDRNHADVYRRLLRRNLQPAPWRFALDADGDVFAAADTPRLDLDADRLDALLGALSTTVDEVFEGLVRLGFDVPDGTSIGPPPGDDQTSVEPKQRASL